METLSKKEKQEITDKLGEQVIVFRDRALSIRMNWATGKSINPVMRMQYAELSELTEKQYELVCNLLSSAISGTIYSFLEMIEENQDWMKLLIKNKGIEYDLCQVSEKMGSEIVDATNTGWIPKFSKVGRLIL